MKLIFTLWAIAALWLALHYLFFHSRLLRIRPAAANATRPVSIVICARNEAQHLSQFLPKVLLQKYPPGFEVVVVNDHSTDDTGRVLQQLAEGHGHLRVVPFYGPKKHIGKKEALLIGIQNARYNHFLFTDADCEPSSPDWLQTMANHFGNKEIVLGISPYRPGKNLAGLLTAWETLLTSQQYISLAMAGLPYMGVGRNMAYTRGVFNQSSKMRKHLHLPSGDDDLMISEVATPRNVAVEVSAKAQTLSTPPPDFRKWWRQKRRHLSTSYYYKKPISVFLGAFGLAQLLFYALLIPVIIFYWSHPLLHFLLWGKLALQMITMLPFAYKTGQERSAWYFIFAEPLVVLFLGILHIQNKIAGSSKDW